MGRQKFLLTRRLGRVAAAVRPGPILRLISNAFIFGASRQTA
jgi:hypothetical protein